ncbi:hypothetical protein A33O_19936 [Nitratireductor aquibiodomus RA22]|uniref:Uncharacterized protein n=1 Tax=Nitratireductor aquibiodomus RA22 TaxID=1189611 RepID=I5BS67_9HYPH|nr:hypothetical protein A33O_19936 [Nitratireductor aquibiodomus RA22]
MRFDAAFAPQAIALALAALLLQLKIELITSRKPMDRNHEAAQQGIPISRSVWIFNVCGAPIVHLF